MKGFDIEKLGGAEALNKRTAFAMQDLTNVLQKDITIFPFRFSDKHKEYFYLELATLMSSGLDIKSSLELIEGEQTKPKHAQLISGIKNNLVNGDSLWEALERSGQFTPYEYYSVQIGEETGKLVPVMEQLHQYFSTKLKQSRQLVSALSYPVIILITSIGAVGFMLVFIVPMFSNVFKRFGGELPYLTKLIINFSQAVTSYVWIIVIVFFSAVAYLYYQRHHSWFKKFSSSFIGKIPIIGKIVYALQIARFCNSMSMLLSAKVPMIRALSLTKQMIEFHPINVTLDAIGAGIMMGRSLHEELGRFPVYNKRMVSLIKVGEEVNRLDVFFEKLSKQYSGEAEHQTSLLSTFLEPAMIIFLGVVVGFILLAMYLPMFQMSTNIGG